MSRPPRLAPNWFRPKSGLTCSKWFFAFSTWPRKYSNAFPWNSLAPDFVDHRNQAAGGQPVLGFVLRGVDLELADGVLGKFCRGSPCSAHVFVTPSAMNPLL